MAVRRPRWPRVVEIYPRLFTPGLVKSRHRERREWMKRSLPKQNPVLIERAAGSEDALDAAASALVMAAQVEALETRPRAAADAVERLEGAIWSPPRP